jgi:hypothetical protein
MQLKLFQASRRGCKPGKKRLQQITFERPQSGRVLPIQGFKVGGNAVNLGGTADFFRPKQFSLGAFYYPQGN